MIQIALISYDDNANDTVVYVAMAVSILSIVILVLSMVSRRDLLRSTDYVTVEFDVTEISNTNKCRNNVTNIHNELSSLLGLNKSLLEICRPSFIPKGLKMIINVRINKTKQIDMNIERMINNAANSGELAQIIKRSWSLSSEPFINNIKSIRHDSKEKEDNTVLIKTGEQQNLASPETMSHIEIGEIVGKELKIGAEMTMGGNGPFPQNLVPIAGTIFVEPGNGLTPGQEIDDSDDDIPTPGSPGQIGENERAIDYNDNSSELDELGNDEPDHDIVHKSDADIVTVINETPGDDEE